jgi:hypothetical protein
MKTIVKACIIYNGGLYIGWRHCFIGCDMVKNGYCPRPYPSGDAQGFITSDGEYVGREDALKIAKEAGQTILDVGPKGELYSEQLWDIHGVPHLPVKVVDILEECRKNGGFLPEDMRAEDMAIIEAGSKFLREQEK